MEKKILDIENKIFNIKEVDKNLLYSKYKAKNIDKFKNKKVIAFAGIGNPENFFEFIKNNNINIIRKNKISRPL